MKQNKMLAALPYMGVLIFCGMLSLSGCSVIRNSERFNEVNVHTWETEASSTDFPEMADSRVNVPYLKERPSGQREPRGSRLPTEPCVRVRTRLLM